LKLLGITLSLAFLFSCHHKTESQTVVVKAPTSVASKISPDQAILLTITEKGVVFILLGDSTPKRAIYSYLDTSNNLGLTDSQIDKLNQIDTIGVALKDLATFSNAINNQFNQIGISISDTLNSELSAWLKAFVGAYGGLYPLDKHLILKLPNNYDHIDFKNIQAIFRRSGVTRFRIVTNAE